MTKAMKVFTYIMMVGALCCLFCYSKEKEDAPTGATFNKTFVTGYLTPESIVISKMNSGIKITFKGDLITSGRSFDALSNITMIYLIIDILLMDHVRQLMIVYTRLKSTLSRILMHRILLEVIFQI